MAHEFDSDLSFNSFILALTTSIGALLSSETLLSYSTQNPESLIMDLLIRLLIFILIPVTFLLGSKLLFLLISVPSNSSRGEIYAVRINRITNISLTMSLTTLLVGLGIGVYLVLPEAVAAWWFPW